MSAERRVPAEAPCQPLDRGLETRARASTRFQTAGGRRTERVTVGPHGALNRLFAAGNQKASKLRRVANAQDFEGGSGPPAATTAQTRGTSVQWSRDVMRRRGRPVGDGRGDGIHSDHSPASLPSRALEARW